MILSVPLPAEDVVVFDVTVAAGKHDRLDTPVSVALASEVKDLQLFETTGGTSKEVIAQLEPGKPPRLHWILAGSTSSGSTRTFRGFAGGSKPRIAAEGITISDEKGKHYEFRYQGKGIFRYNYGMVRPSKPEIPEAQTRNAYLHPVWTPAERQVTMDYPSNHLHHRGIWFPWTKTEFEGRHPDFWNLGDQTGTVRYDRTEALTSGPVFGGLRVRQRHVDLKAPEGEKDALHEVWDVRIYAVGGSRGKPENGFYIFDLESVQECAGPSPLKLLEYRYGGLGFRGSWDWEGDNVKFLTSEGKTRKDGHGTRARWCDISGPVGGKPAGVIIFCHPKNFRFPQPMRIHPSEPFFNFAPVQAGDMEIVPGKPYVSRYRFVVHDGEMTADEAERFWRDYAEPPAVSLKS
ncbi:MAG: PmoA family protein [Planctomycetes bacterium]|nr:PmoA family protein [Planctomycetota bacterium]